MSKRPFTFAVEVFAAAVAVVGCSSTAAIDATGTAQEAVRPPTCNAGETLVCSASGDPGDGTKGSRSTCVCEAPPPPATIWSVTSLPHDTARVHDATSNDFHGAGAFVQPPELQAYGCTPTVLYYNDLDVSVPGTGGGRLWACPSDKQATIVSTINSAHPLSGFCTSKRSYASGTSIYGGAYLGNTVSGWFFFGEACLSDLGGGEGMTCGGPCMIR